MKQDFTKQKREIFTKHLIDFQKTHVPKCVNCGKPFVHTVDSITKKKSKYLWKPDCGCLPDKLILSVG